MQGSALAQRACLLLGVLGVLGATAFVVVVPVDWEGVDCGTVAFRHDFGPEIEEAEAGRGQGNPAGSFDRSLSGMENQLAFLSDELVAELEAAEDGCSDAYADRLIWAGLIVIGSAIVAGLGWWILGEPPVRERSRAGF